MSMLSPETSLLHYRIVEKIGRGGMGEVYRGWDTKLARHVAIKLLPEEATRDPIAKRRLLKEAQSASALNHPNIVTIYSIDEVDGLDFIVMEYVEGETLKSVIDRTGPLPPPTLIDFGIQVAEALDAAHAIGLVHRDIKSSNILITPRGHAKVLDFGLAKMMRNVANAVDHDAPTIANITTAGVVMGTAAYMSPEQTRGEDLDGRSDIFSFGSVLYEAATGQLPFTGPTMLTVMHNVAIVPAPPVSRHRRDLPPEFDLIIERALAKDPGQRYASAGDLANALRNLKEASIEFTSGFGVLAKASVEDGAPSLFVGRESEVEKLDGLLRQALGGSGRVVFITGEPGIGKTSLADEFMRRARRQYPGLLFSRGACAEQYGTGEAYLPFLDALGALLTPGRERMAAVLRTYAPTWCLQLPAAFTSTGSLENLQRETIGATKERMMREMGDALGAMAASNPLVLLLEDLHWADPSSVDLLRHLCQRISGQRLMLIGTFRPEDIASSGHPLKNYLLEMQAHDQCQEIPLGMLTRDHIAAYLEASFAPNDFPKDLSGLIQQKTEGHPLFATSLVQYLVERGDIGRANEHWSLTRPLVEMDLEAPETVRSMIRKKIESLNDEDRRTLQYASVEGREFLSTIVAKLLGVDEVDLEERLAHLQKVHRLVMTVGEEELPDRSLATRYRFAHALFQNFLYGELVNKRRILLHQQAGEQLALHYGSQVPRIATQLAMHFELGRDFNKAIEFLVIAGDNATHLYANDEAESHYSRALDLIEKLPPEEQLQKSVVIFQKRGGVNFSLSRFTQAADDFTKMADQARALSNLALESGALNALTLTLFYSHRLDEMAARGEEALRIAERTGSEESRLQTVQLIALKQLCYGELTAARDGLDEVIRRARVVNNKPALVNALAWRGLLYFFQTDYASAEEALRESRALALEIRDGFLVLLSLFALGLTRGNLGRMSEALATLKEALDMGKRNGDRFWLPRLPNCIGWIHRELQDFEGALKHDQRGLDIGREHHVLEAQANSLINLGIDFNHTGKSEHTLPKFNEAESIFDVDAWFRWRYNIRLQAGTSEYWLAKGDLDKAREYALRTLETARHFECHKYIAVAHKLLGQIATTRGDFTEAEKAFNTALDELWEFPVPIVTWKVYAEMGRQKSQSGDTVGSREAFAKAANTVNSIAANVKDEKLRETFLNSAAVKDVLKRSAA